MFPSAGIIPEHRDHTAAAPGQGCGDPDSCNSQNSGQQISKHDPDQAEVHSELEQLQVNLLEGEELDVKAVLSFSTTVMKNIPLEAIEGVEEQEIDSNVLAGLPSAVIYIAAPGDDLWSIGRKYHMPVKTVRELNALESDELRPGQKVLLVKGLA